MNDARLSVLIDRHLDGQLSDVELNEFEELLLGSAAARSQFWRESRLHAQLHEVESAGAKRAAPGRNPAPPRGLWLALGACAAAACLALFATGGRWPWREAAPVEATSAAIAVLSQALDAQWRAPGEAHAVGEALEPGWLHLRSGLVRVEFYNGVRMVVEGPADLQLVSAGAARLDAGRISAEVPPVARGFAVRTPHLQVVDLGTAFGIHVDGARDEVHVFTGRVTLQAGSAAAHELHAGEAVRVVGDAVPEPMPAAPGDFQTAAELDRRTGAVQDQRAQAWRDAAARLDADPALLVRFDCAHGSGADRTLRNLSAHGAEAGDGTIIGCARSVGRWPGTEALEFLTQSDRVRLAVPGEHHQLTLVAWVRVEALEHAFNSLFMTDGFDVGALHWQIRGNGSLHLGLSRPLGRPAEPYNFDSPGVFTPDRLGRWTQLVAVYDGPRGAFIQYVDGQPVGRFTLVSDLALRIGHGELGNWNPGDSRDGAPIRNLKGRLDEFALLTRALDDAEVAALYRASAPHAAGGR